MATTRVSQSSISCSWQVVSYRPAFRFGQLHTDSVAVRGISLCLERDTVAPSEYGSSTQIPLLTRPLGASPSRCCTSSPPDDRLVLLHVLRMRALPLRQLVLYCRHARKVTFGMGFLHTQIPTSLSLSLSIPYHTTPARTALQSPSSSSINPTHAGSLLQQFPCPSSSGYAVEAGRPGAGM